VLVFSDDNATAGASISVSAEDNDVDEGGAGLVSNQCTLLHVLNSTEKASKYEGLVVALTVQVHNDDVADLTLQAGQSGFVDKVNTLGPLCLVEGQNVSYRVGLSSRPIANVVVHARLVIPRATSPLLLTVNPSVFTIQPSDNWGVPRAVVVSSFRDYIDNDVEIEDIRIHYYIKTEDAVFQSSATNATAIVQVTDHLEDVAGVVFTPLSDTLSVQEGEEVSVRVVRFRTRPRAPVNLTLVLQGAPPALVSVSPRRRVYKSLSDWRAVGAQNLSFTIRTEKGDYLGYQGMVARMVCHSTDTSYSKTIEFPLNVVEDPVVPPPPRKPTLVRVAGSLLAVRAEWAHAEALSATQAFEVQWSQVDDAFGPGTNSTTTSSFSVSLNVTRPLTLSILFVRIRVVGPTPSPWSAVSNAWQIAKQCDMTQQYLNSSGPFVDWRCDSCPAGAWCVGVETTWEDVEPLLGWWRNDVWREDAGSNFTRCSFPPACLGARNFAFKGKFEGVDAAVHRNESCNIGMGYTTVCTRREDQRCRLCATCAVGYRRLDGGGMQCAKCPSMEANRALMSIGAIVVFVIISSMVIDHMISGGTIDVPNMQQIIVINYFQLTYMIAGTNVAWPDALKIIFDIEGAFSTIGEHLLNPACELTTVPAAEIVYSKQIAYMVVLPCLLAFFKVLWRLLAKCQGRSYRYRGVDRRSPSHKDGSVATTVYVVYLLYPTLCRQAFGLLVCKEVDGAYYLEADMQEECYTGRHMYYLIFCTLPQIVFHVIGIPIQGLLAANRGRKKREKMHFSISLFRYGMLYSAYGPKRWFWEAVIASRKAMIVLVTSLFDEAGQEVHWLILFLSISIMGNLFLQPYIGAQGINEKDALGLQRFDSTALFVLLVTAWSGVYFDINQRCSSEQEVACSILLVCVVALNAGFLCFCLYQFRNKLVSIKLFVLDVMSCGKTKMVDRMRRNTQRRNSVHLNPLAFRATLVRKQTFDNPLHGSKRIGKGMVENPLRRKRQAAAKELEWQAKVVEMRTVRARSNADRREKIRRIASFKLQAKRKQQHSEEESGEQSGKALKWLKAVDPESGKEFYYNDETREAVWELPDGCKESQEDV
jgi:hypothetical protein